MEADRDALMRRVAAALAVVVVLGFFSVFVMLAFFEVPASNKDTFTQMSGALILAFGGLMGYLYGSTKNSEAKDRALAAQATNGTQPLVVSPPATVEVKKASK